MMKLRRTLGCSWGIGVLALAGSAQAVTQPAHLSGQPPLEIAAGPAARVERVLSWTTPPPHAAVAWRGLVAELGPSTQAVWDPDTGVPSRIWGRGVELPGSLASAATAAKHGQAFIARHLELLAPGAVPSDFELSSNDLDHGMRTLGFRQLRAGLPVLGGQLSLRIKNDRLFMIGSEALPHVAAPTTTAPLASATAGAAARTWMLQDTASATVTAVEGPFVLPIVSPGRVTTTTVMRVIVAAAQPLGHWHVYVDAQTAAPVAREQLLRFATGTVLYNAPERRPGDLRLDYPAAFTALQVDGSNVTSDGSGTVSWPGTAETTVVTHGAGTYGTVNNVAGGEASVTLPLPPSSNAVWTDANTEQVDAQISAFVHLNKVMDHARVMAPSLPYLETSVPANVNINDACNAFYNPQSGTLNFYLEDENCNNTARLADVVYHEFGHSLHAQSLILGVGAFDGAASEGLSDYLAATITNDSGMGRGFFKSDLPLRDIDPPDGEHVWPDDIGEIHYTGLIISGALWDLRKLLIAEQGQSQGVATTDTLYFQAMRRAVDIPTMYFEVLAADDDDGDLANGTPNVCAINEAFGAHGLRRMMALPNNLSTQPPGLEGYEVTLGLIGLYAQCPDDPAASAELTWRLREDTEVGGSLPMTLEGTSYRAVIPTQPDGSVVQYQVAISLGTAPSIAYPANAADPFYEFFIGHVEPIYCTDFETDPADDGWTHGLTSGQAGEGADDWQWGEPLGMGGSGDPREAHSGDKVFGNDLGGGVYNGMYQNSKVNYGLSPTVDTTGYDHVRLQYRRWLNVEDGHFDQGNIYAGDLLVWTNLDSNQDEQSTVHHRDREWRFHDVDVSDQVVDDQVAIKFEIDSDQGLTLGGWTLDDVCLVGWIPTVCGDGLLTGMEQCDDGEQNSDTEPDACRNDCTAANCGDGTVDSGEECDDGNLVDDDDCRTDCTPTLTDDPPSEGDDSFIVTGGGCGCTLPAGDRSAGGLSLLALALAAALRRRRPTSPIPG